MIPENNITRHTIMKKSHVRNAILETIQESEYFSHIMCHSPWTYDNVIDVTIGWIKIRLVDNGDIAFFIFTSSIVGEDSIFVNDIPRMEDPELKQMVNICGFAQQIAKKTFEF